jgi:3-methylfumaryl-CoA hydratase
MSAVKTDDILTLAQVRRVAVMLGIDPTNLTDGDPLPRGWHFAMLAGETPRPALRSDGFPGLGIAMPQLDRPRLLLGQRTSSFQGRLLIGGRLERKSRIASIVDKVGKAGPLSIVKVEHALSSDDGSAWVEETQTYFLAGLPNAGGAAAEPPKTPPIPPPDGEGKVVTPDDLMLFQYSALGFNTHRIHFDRDYARRVERHPDLVVNGGLATLLATEFLRVDLGKTVKTLSARHLAPLYVNRPLTILVTEPTEFGAKVLLLDSAGIVAAELGVTFDDL